MTEDEQVAALVADPDAYFRAARERAAVEADRYVKQLRAARETATTQHRTAAASPAGVSLAMSEGDYLDRITDLASRCGWMWHHGLPAQVRGTRTITAASGSRGFPDLVLVRAGVILLWEVKAERGRFRPGQQEWVAEAGARGRVVRPSDWAWVQGVLTARTPAARV